MNSEVFPAITDVEPFSRIQDDAADLAALPYPFRQDRDVGNVLRGRDPLENRPRPDANPSEIVLTCVAVSIGHVNDTVPFQGDVFTEMTFAQRQSDIVPSARMFIEQRLKIDVRQDVAAVADKHLVTQ